MDAKNIRKYFEFSWKNKSRFIPYIAIYAVVIIIPTVLLPFGAKWFAKSDDNAVNMIMKHSIFINHYFYPFSVLPHFYSQDLLVLFLIFMIGKCFCCFQRSSPTINLALFTFYVNFWMFWSLTVINALFTASSAMNSMNPLYIMDAIQKKHLQSSAYMIVLGVMTLCLIIGAIGGPVLQVDYVWIVVSSLYGLTTLYVLIFMAESLRVNRKRNLEWKNPFKSLVYLNANSLVLCLCIIGFLQQILSTLVPILLIYINDQMGINNESETNAFNKNYKIIFVSLGIAGIFCSGMLLPMLQIKCKVSKLYLCVIAHVAAIFGVVMFILIKYFARELYYILIVIMGIFFYYFMRYIESATKSITTKYINKNELGIAFELIRSYKSITVVLTPLIFGWGYNLSETVNMPSISVYFIGLLILLSVVVTVFPLRKIIRKLEETKDTLSFNIGNDNKSLLDTDITNKKQL